SCMSGNERSESQWKPWNSSLLRTRFRRRRGAMAGNRLVKEVEARLRDAARQNGKARRLGVRQIEMWLCWGRANLGGALPFSVKAIAAVGLAPALALQVATRLLDASSPARERNR